jgi:DNA-binding NtrC family response regulator
MVRRMTTILLIGSDVALLEGLSQSLAAGGYVTHLSSTIAEATELASVQPPLVAVVERALASRDMAVLRLPLAQGGALVLYRPSVEDPGALSPALQRAVLADLTLPLERHRLVALIQRVEERARATGRGQTPTPEQRAP